MEPINYVKPVRKSYTTLRMWTQTRDKFKRLANYFDIPMTEFLESLATQMIQQFMEAKDGGSSQKDIVSAPTSSTPVQTVENPEIIQRDTNPTWETSQEKGTDRPSTARDHR